MEEGRGSINDVLVVDDNPGDRRFISEAFRASQMDLTIFETGTSDEALDVVNHRGEYNDSPVLDVILLDWNLSQTTGEEVLTAAKASESPIPVVVMTSSKAQMDELQSSCLQADMVIEKPTDPTMYIQTLAALQTEQ